MQPDLDPARRYVSDYALGRGGILFGVALLAYGVGTAASAAGLARRSDAHRPLVVAGLGVVAVGVVVAGLVATDPPGVDTTSGAVHSAGATVAFVGTGLLALVVPLRARSDRRGETVLLGVARVAPAASLVALALVPEQVGGAVERLVVVADLVWIELAPSRVRGTDDPRR